MINSLLYINFIRLLIMKLNIRIRNLRWTEAFLKCIRDFMANTSLHAFQHITERSRHWTERLVLGCSYQLEEKLKIVQNFWYRILWIIVHTVTITSAIFIVLYAWNQFTLRPTFTTMDNQHYSIKYIAFPAVSICSNNKISKTAAEKYSQYL